MTVSTLNTANAYVGDSVNDDFTITFEFFDKEDIRVDVRTTATGALSLEILDTDYTVSGGAGEQGAISTAIRTARVTADEVIIISRVSGGTQDVDLTPATDVPTASIEEALDRDALRIQEIRDTVDNRVMAIPRSDIDEFGVFPNMALPDKALRGVAGALLAFNASGEPIISVAAVPVASTSVFGAAFILLADDVAARGPTGGGGIQTIHNRGLNFDSIEAGLASARPTAATFGDGLWFSTDTQQLSYSDSSSFSQVVIDQRDNASLPTATANPGQIFLDTDQNVMHYDDGVDIVPVESPWARGTLGALRLSFSSSTTLAHSAGEARCTFGQTGGQNVFINTGTKLTNATFATGSGNGGVASGAFPMANDTLHFAFLLGTTQGVADIGIDSNIVGTNLLNDAAVQAAGLNQFLRRIGSFYSDGSGDLLEFFQDGDHFQHKTPVLSFIDVGDVDYSLGLNRTLTHSPLSSLTDITFNIANFEAAVGLFRIFDPNLTDEAPVVGAAPGAMQKRDADNIGYGRVWVRTDSSSQVRIRSTIDTTIQVSIITNGWIDTRNKDE